MAMEMVFLPLVGIHVLVGVVKVFAREGLRLLEAISRNGEVDIENQQKQGDANARHHSAEIKPKTVFILCFAHNDLQRKGKKRDFVRFSIDFKRFLAEGNPKTKICVSLQPNLKSFLIRKRLGPWPVEGPAPK